jgi:hypothetical protein
LTQLIRCEVLKEVTEAVIHALDSESPYIIVVCTLPSQRLGTKALILDPNVSGSLTLLDASLPELLTEHGVVK